MKIGGTNYKVDFDIILRWIKATPHLSEQMNEIIEKQVKKNKGDLGKILDDIDRPDNNDVPVFRKLVIDGILDLKKTMGDEDFDDLYLDNKTK